ncbi:NADP-dependent oxidoreductase [Undibacterium cyanobacteriorum]|uniref:NADP-dependent oxidoreductase n=1 Tax=Undibacterium cyanobacteriorum TaxID=3073561 RepID=A0ABY9RNQ9_9BURK|nr:NADP-dependent oxidoreductase [Undibacterium sp. 20NA77.5]WMW82528.1 NADP-dependent oxidoreductase [Undibacterium sp. 20NA77.5]
MPKQYRRIVLASRPQQHASVDNFRLETLDIPELTEGQVLIKNHFLSLDPYMRVRMNAERGYADPQALNETMIGGTVGTIVATKNARFTVGEKVIGMMGWAEMGVSDGVLLRKLDTSHIPLSAYLGAVGMPGMTAWYGLTQIMQVKAGETVLVSAASGAVGSVVGQLAKLQGCRVIGIAGGSEKCEYVVNQLGFDACVDYKSQDWQQQLIAASPQGIDAIFENVGGEVFDACLLRMNPFGRIALCGMIAGYESEELPIKNARVLLTQRLTVRGFIISEHMDLWPQGLKELGSLVASGKIKFKESIAPDLAAAPEAFLGLLKGKNFGKQLVRLLPE